MLTGQFRPARIAAAVTLGTVAARADGGRRLASRHVARGKRRDAHGEHQHAQTHGPHEAGRNCPFKRHESPSGIYTETIAGGLISSRRKPVNLKGFARRARFELLSPKAQSPAVT